jgi:ribonuclease D
MSKTSVAPEVENRQDSLSVVDRDLPLWAVDAFRKSPVTAWDIETSGLDWANDRIATCQVYSPLVGAFVVRISGEPPRNLIALLEDEEVVKVFHHAMFDLRFIYAQWSQDVRSVFCTKIAAKILMPSSDKTTLQDLTREFLGVHLDKSERMSNWLANDLSIKQLNYAAADVRYLPALMAALHIRLNQNDSWDLAVACYDFLPTRVKLDLLGSADVFAYK